MFILSLLFSLISFAQAGAYYECDIVNGKVFSCDGSWYQGKAVVYR